MFLQYLHLGVDLSSYSALIDANDKLEEGEFVYTDGTVPDNFPWFWGEPNDIESGEDVAALTAAGFLIDVNEEIKSKSICQIGKFCIIVEVSLHHL